MAITVVTKGGSSSTTNAASYTATITAPTTNRVQLAFILNSKASLPDIPSSVVSTGLTWQFIATVAFAPEVPTPFRRLSVYSAQGTSSDTTVAINFAANQTACAWSFVELNGVDISGVSGINAIAKSTVAADGGSQTTPANLDLGGIVFTGDAVIAAFGLDTTSAITPTEGFTELHDITLGTAPNGRLQTQYHLTYDATPRATWTSSSAGGIALELKAIENAFKSNPMPSNQVTISDGPPTVLLIQAARLISVGNAVTLTDDDTVQIWQTQWVGTVNLLDMPKVAELVTISHAIPVLTVTPEAVWMIPAANQVTLTDTATVAGLAWVIPVADLLTTTENLTGITLTSIAGLAINVNESMALTDVVTPHLLNERQSVDLLTVSETARIHTVDTIHAEDLATLTDATTVFLLLQPRVADLLTLTDTPTLRGLILLIPVTDSLTATDAAQAIPAGSMPTENFDDNVTNAGLWTVEATRTATDALVLVSESSHQLRITPRTIAGDAFNGYRAIAANNFTDTGVFAEVPQVANSASTARTSLVLAIDTSNGYDITQEGGQLFFEYEIGNVTTVAGQTAYVAETHRWWRIRHVSSGDTIRYDTSVNGTVWTERLSIPRPASLPVTALRIGVQAGTYASVASPGVAIFDNLNSTTLTIFPDNVLTLTDTLTIKGLIPKITAANLITLIDDPTIGFGGTLLIEENNAVTVSDAAEAELVAPMADLMTVSDSAIVQRWMTGWAGTVNLLDMPHSAELVTVTHAPVTVSLIGVGGPPTISVDDLVTLTDTATVRGLILLVPAIDLLTPTDASTVAGLTLRQTAVDTLTSSDTPTVQVIHAPLAANLLTLTDTLTITLVHEPHAADLLTSTDVVVVAGLIPAIAASNLLTITDQVTVSGLTLRIPAVDFVTILDASTVIRAVEGVWQITGSDLLTVTDAVAVIGLIPAVTANDLVTLTDTPAVTGLIPAISVSNLLTTTDQVTVTGLTLLTAQVDLVTIIDAATVIRAISGVWQIAVDESLTLTDTSLVTGLILKSGSADSLTLTDLLTVNLVETVLAANAVTSTDTATTRLLLMPRVTETLTTTDVVTLKGLTLTLSRVDTVTLTDLGTVTFAAVISRVDTLTVTDVSTIRLLLSPRVTESVLVVDTASVWAGFRFGDLLTISDSVAIFTIGGMVTHPTISYSAPGRAMTVTSVVGVSPFTVPARAMTVEAQAPARTLTVPSRAMTVTAVVGVSTFTVPARNMTVESAA